LSIEYISEWTEPPQVSKKLASLTPNKLENPSLLKQGSNGSASALLGDIRDADCGAGGVARKAL